MTGEKVPVHAFSNEHGSTSSGDDLDGMADNSRCTSSVVTGSKDDNAGPRYGLSVNALQTVDCSATAMLLRMRFTLSTKNLQKVDTSFAHSPSLKTSFRLLCYSERRRRLHHKLHFKGETSTFVYGPVRSVGSLSLRIHVCPLSPSYHCRILTMNPQRVTAGL